MSSSAAGAADVRSDWDLALDELEARLAAAESIAVSSGTIDAPAAWTPPTGLGPMPARVQARARALAERQDHVLVELADACDRTQRQMSVVDQLRSNADRGAAPAFLDRAF